MNRQEAKEVMKLPDSLLREILCHELANNRKFAEAYAQGKTIAFDGEVSENLSFVRGGGHYKIIEPTKTINGIEVPMHLTEKPEHDRTYFYEDITNPNYFNSHVWANESTDHILFQREICYATSEDAARVCKVRHGVEE